MNFLLAALSLIHPSEIKYECLQIRPDDEQSSRVRETFLTMEHRDGKNFVRLVGSDSREDDIRRQEVKFVRGRSENRLFWSSRVNVRGGTEATFDMVSMKSFDTKNALTYTITSNRKLIKKEYDPDRDYFVATGICSRLYRK
jgi:hypothetical protein